MTSTHHNPTTATPVAGGYSQGLEVRTPGRLLHISGQIPEDRSGNVPTSFDDQCRQVWRNVEAVIASADMTLDDLVKVTTFLSGGRYREANARIRQQVLGDAVPALTVIVVGIYDEQWLLEIEAIAYQHD